MVEISLRVTTIVARREANLFGPASVGKVVRSKRHEVILHRLPIKEPSCPRVDDKEIDTLVRIPSMVTQHPLSSSRERLSVDQRIEFGENRIVLNRVERRLQGARLS